MANHCWTPKLSAHYIKDVEIEESSQNYEDHVWLTLILIHVLTKLTIVMESLTFDRCNCSLAAH